MWPCLSCQLSEKNWRELQPPMRGKLKHDITIFQDMPQTLKYWSIQEWNTKHASSTPFLQGLTTYLPQLPLGRKKKTDHASEPAQANQTKTFLYRSIDIYICGTPADATQPANFELREWMWYWQCHPNRYGKELIMRKASWFIGYQSQTILYLGCSTLPCSFVTCSNKLLPTCGDFRYPSFFLARCAGRLDLSHLHPIWQCQGLIEFCPDWETIHFK